MMSGLQNCLQLRKLYLYDNKISEIAHLELQVHLEVLWLNNNRITHVQVCAVAGYELTRVSLSLSEELFVLPVCVSFQRV